MALGSTTQNRGHGREHYGWEFNPGPLRTRPHGKARFTNLRVWFSACWPQQSATDAASTSSSMNGILEPPVHFCPPGIPTLNCLFVLLLIVGQSAVRRQFLQLSLALCAKACQRRTVPPVWWDGTRPNGDTAMRMEAARPSESFAPSTTLPSHRKARLKSLPTV